MGHQVHRMAVLMVIMLLVGATLGLLGSGGSLITLPVLVYVAGIPASQAVVMSLTIVGLVSTVGAVVQGQKRGVDLRAVTVFAVVGGIGAIVGSRLTHVLSDAALMAGFGLLMVVVAIRVLVVRGPANAGAVLQWRLVPCSGAALVVGVLTGFFGVGGGFLIVPALLWCAGTDIKRAVPTSLAVVALNATVGLAGHLHAARIPVLTTTACVAAAAVGVLIGSRLSDRVASGALQRAFAGVVLILGVTLLILNAGPAAW